tara:strand:- start:298 stop:1131 length:834 start_codon:yes stop_codon:yes gene_type:complete
MIIWLASYPKSGNTWVRLFLNSLVFTSDAFVNINDIRLEQFPTRKYFKDITNNVDDLTEFIQNCNYAQSKLNLDNKIKFFKTHNGLWKIGQHRFTDNENTLGVIHIVRDPRNVVTSIKNHYNYRTYEEALDFIKDENKILGKIGSEKEEDLPTIVSSWKLHYKSWKNLGGLERKYILIKYEDLIKDPVREFTKITSFIENISKITFDEKNILKAIENTKFENLKKQEELKGFKESPKNSIKFFHLGPKNDWQNILDKKIKDDIEISFGNEMQDLGYL